MYVSFIWPVDIAKYLNILDVSLFGVQNTFKIIHIYEFKINHSQNTATFFLMQPSLYDNV